MSLIVDGSLYGRLGNGRSQGHSSNLEALGQIRAVILDGASAGGDESQRSCKPQRVRKLSHVHKCQVPSRCATSNYRSICDKYSSVRVNETSRS